MAASLLLLLARCRRGNETQRVLGEMQPQRQQRRERSVERFELIAVGRGGLMSEDGWMDGVKRGRSCCSGDLRERRRQG